MRAGVMNVAELLRHSIDESPGYANRGITGRSRARHSNTNTGRMSPENIGETPNYACGLAYGFTRTPRVQITRLQPTL